MIKTLMVNKKIDFSTLKNESGINFKRLLSLMYCSEDITLIESVSIANACNLSEEEYIKCFINR